MRIWSRIRIERASILSAIGLVSVMGASLADEIRIHPVRDATLIESPAGALANGSGPAFFAGRTSQGSNSVRRALLEFDVASILPPGSTMTGAFLTLNMTSTSGGPATVGLHRVLAAWGEGASFAAGGGGSPSTPGDATWLHTFYDTVFWAAPGGDFDPSPRSSVLVDQAGAYTWDSGEEMIADVQSWLDAPGTNDGWILIGDEASPTSVKRFDSRESPDEALRPVLRVQYTPPCIPDDPRGPGYWQRQCLATDWANGSGRGPAGAIEPGFADRVAPCAGEVLARFGLGPATACEGIRMPLPQDPCEQALRFLTSLAFNLCANRIQTSCPVGVLAPGCASATVGDLLGETAALIRAGQCRVAARCAAGVPGGVSPRPE